MSRNDAKQLTEQFQAVLLQLQTAVAEIEDQINVALAALAALEDRACPRGFDACPAIVDGSCECFATCSSCCERRPDRP